MAEIVRTLRIEVKAEEVQRAKGNVSALQKEIKILSDVYGQNSKAVRDKTVELEKEKVKLKELQQEQKQNIILEREQKDSVNALRAQLALNTQELNKMTIAERQNSDRGKELTAQTKQISDALKLAEKSVGDTRRSVGDYEESMKSAIASSGLFSAQFGVLSKVMTTGRAIITTVTVAFKTLRGAIMATGIGALIVALGSLVTYFTKTERGANKFSEVMAGIKATIAVIIDRFIVFGEGLANIFSGNFRAGAKQIQATFKGIGSEIANESKEAVQLEKQLNRLIQKERDLNESMAERTTRINELRLASKDENKTLAERLAALDEAKKIQATINNDEIYIAKERARILSRQTELAESTTEELKAASDARANASQVEARAFEAIRTIQTERLRLVKGVRNAEIQAAKQKADADKDELERQKALLAEKKKAEEDLAKAKIDLEDKIYLMSLNQHDKELAETMAFYDNLIAEAEKYGVDTIAIKEAQESAITLITKKNNEEKVKDAKESADRILEIEKQIQDKKNDLANAGKDLALTITNELFSQQIAAAEGNAEKQKDIKKKQAILEGALGVAEVGINTFKAVAALQAIAAVQAAGVVTAPLAPLTLAQIPFVIGTGVANAAAIVAATALKGFADGGVVQGQNIPTQSNGDNVLATVKTGEVILNSRQQQLIGGAPTFRKIGVPGFANGGVVGADIPASVRGMASGKQIVKVIQVQRDFEKSQKMFKVAQTQGDF